MDKPLLHENVLYLMKLHKRNDTSDESLIAAFESLFHEYWAPIYRLLLRMVTDPAEAEDLALETFWRLYKHHPEPQAQFNTRGWLQRVAANLALQSIRSFKRREQYEINAGRDAGCRGGVRRAPRGRRHSVHSFTRLRIVLGCHPAFTTR
mgnify:CR=1 FL=1